MKFLKNFDFVDFKNPNMFSKMVSSSRALSSEAIKIVFVIGVVTFITWGISYADEIPLIKKIIEKSEFYQTEQRTFSTRGYTSEVSASSIIIYNAKNREGKTGFSYTVDIAGAHIKSYTGEELSLSDLKTNQEVVTKGLLDGDIIIAHTIIIFGDISPFELTATTTDEATTSTDELATSTDENASSTDENASSSNESATSTDSTIDKIKDVFNTVVDTVSDAVIGTIGSVMNVFTGTTTSSTTPDSSDTATSSAATSTEEVSTIPVEQASSTDPVSEPVESEPDPEPLPAPIEPEPQPKPVKIVEPESTPEPTDIKPE